MQELRMVLNPALLKAVLALLIGGRAMRDDSRDNRLKPLSEALEDHSAEGIGQAILSAEPWKMMQISVLVMVALVMRAGVVVRPGTPM
ncbi:hypothetical protein ACU4GD_32780 [Cupriavidus basilensis]